MKFFLSLFRRAQKRSECADLLAMDDHLLRDIGLTRAQVAEMMTGPVAHRRSTPAHV